jgi:hypothetical protein
MSKIGRYSIYRQLDAVTEGRDTLFEALAFQAC